jgi:cytidylate kinase
MLSMETNFQVAMDGPAGAGKSTIAKLIAARLHLTHIDTGAMYRAITYEAMQRGIDVTNPDAYDFLSATSVKFENHKIYLNNQDITSHISSPDVSHHVSIVAAHPNVRSYMVQIQQQAAMHGAIIMDGRDIGTVVLPNAPVKIFLTASVKERAARRYKDYQAKGITSSYQELEDEITRRDHIDSTRKTNPLKQADDAILFDTTNHTIEESVELLVQIIQQRGREHGYQF